LAGQGRLRDERLSCYMRAMEREDIIVRLRENEAALRVRVA
jgi:hypothetical protein